MHEIRSTLAPFPWSVPLETMAPLNCAVSFANTRRNSRNAFSNKGNVAPRQYCLHLFRSCKEKRERKRERKKKICNNVSTVIHIYIRTRTNFSWASLLERKAEMLGVPPSFARRRREFETDNHRTSFLEEEEWPFAQTAAAER